jgi:Cft2 family RNA processing exonuclease
MLKNIKPRFYVLLIAYVVALAVYNRMYIENFMSDMKLWKYSYHKEATPDSAINLANYYIKTKQFKMAEQLIRQVKMWEPGHSELIKTALKNIYYDTGTSTLDKINRLENFLPKTELGSFYLSILYSNINNTTKAQGLLRNLMQNEYNYLVYFSERNEETIALYLVLCEKNNLSECENRKNILMSNIQMPFWKEYEFNKHSKKFKENINQLKY